VTRARTRSDSGSDSESESLGLGARRHPARPPGPKSRWSRTDPIRGPTAGTSRPRTVRRDARRPSPVGPARRGASHGDSDRPAGGARRWLRPGNAVRLTAAPPVRSGVRARSGQVRPIVIRVCRRRWSRPVRRAVRAGPSDGSVRSLGARAVHQRCSTPNRAISEFLVGKRSRGCRFGSKPRLEDTNRHSTQEEVESLWLTSRLGGGGQASPGATRSADLAGGGSAEDRRCGGGGVAFSSAMPSGSCVLPQMRVNISNVLLIKLLSRASADASAALV
jgi:hypothetical protein